MVTHSRTSSRAHQLRPLNAPIPLTVTSTSTGVPHALTINQQQHEVARIQDTWIIEDEWWRDPINRQYYSLLLTDGTRRTVFHDRLADTWYLQDY